MANFHMLMVFTIIIVSFCFYTNRKIAMETTALAIIVSLILLFYLVPFQHGIVDYEKFLTGFANPALVALLCLLILGEALSRAGALDRLTTFIISLSSGYRILALLLIFFSVLLISGFLNNIPVVVIFIPIMINLCSKYRMRPGQHMMSLSFVSILGGMTTLIGSSTNLLVSSALIGLGREGFSFFSFTLPALIMVGVGMFYIILIMPLIMRRSGDQNIVGEQSTRNMFFTQFELNAASKLIGTQVNAAGEFPHLPEGLVLQFVKRRHRVFRPPFQGVSLEENDLMVVAVTHEELDKISNNKSLEVFSNIVTASERQGSVQQMGRAEVVVMPHSPMINRTLSGIRFFARYNCVVLGVKRQRQRIEQKIEDMKLEGGDVLLLQGSKDALLSLKRSRNMILMEHSLSDVTRILFMKRTLVIFVSMILLAATGMMPIMITTLLGVLLLLLFSIITVPQALSALDGRIILVIAASLALGMAMEITGGAAFIADLLILVLGNASPSLTLSMFFLITAILSNVLSTKATAILFTPIAVNIANGIGVDYMAFAIAVVFASNCSFASPIGYQTNLLVMGPGGYSFNDFMKAGLPLLFVCWCSFTFLSYYWFFI